MRIELGEKRKKTLPNCNLNSVNENTVDVGIEFNLNHFKNLCSVIILN